MLAKARNAETYAPVHMEAVKENEESIENCVMRLDICTHHFCAFLQEILICVIAFPAF